jgi:hypothetical protein
MLRVLLTVCVAIGDFGQPLDVGMAIDEIVTRDGIAVMEEFIATAVGVAIAVVEDHTCHDVDIDIEDIIEDIGGAAAKEETCAVAAG